MTRRVDIKAILSDAEQSEELLSRASATVTARETGRDTIDVVRGREANRLEDDARALGLQWRIRWFNWEGEPPAFHAFSETSAKPGTGRSWEVIGTNVEEARDCISLAFASKKKGR